MITSGNITKITEYSPPARLYSFGELRFNHVSDNSKAEFINEFSYFEAFEDLYFYKSDVKTLGLETGTALTSVQLKSLKRCLIQLRCEQSYTTTSAEAETLFSVHGNIFGINPELPSLSDLTIDNVGGITTQIEAAVKDYLAQFIYGSHTDTEYSYVQKSSIDIDNDVLLATVITCREEWVDEGGSFRYRDEVCSTNNINRSISELVDIISEGNEFNGTGYTYNQLEIAANAYIEQLPFGRLLLGPILSF